MEQALLSPLCINRDLAEFPIGNIHFYQHQAIALRGNEDLVCHKNAWLDTADIEKFHHLNATFLVDSHGIPLIWTCQETTGGTSIRAVNSLVVQYPWDILRANELYLSAWEKSQQMGLTHKSAHVHILAMLDGKVHIGHNTRILPGVTIEGPVVIGANCNIGPNCYIRGNTSIGDGCHIGNAVEIKNSILLRNTFVGHLSYIGDSILGENVNIGAGTITANFRHDFQVHKSIVNGTLHETGRLKLGAILGDNVKTGIHTSIYPGRKIWPGATTRPGEIVIQDIIT